MSLSILPDSQVDISERVVISCIGDSLTEGDYGVYKKSGIANVKKENYPYFLSQILGVQVRNFGFCGCNASGVLNHYKEGRINIEGSDIVIIMLGTNGGNGIISETKCNIDYKEIIKLIKENAPNSKIVLCTPPHATEDPEKSNFGYFENVINAAAFVWKLSKELNLDIIDVFSCPDFNSDNEDEMQPNDGLHFSEKGYRVLAEFIAKKLKDLYPQILTTHS